MTKVCWDEYGAFLDCLYSECQTLAKRSKAVPRLLDRALGRVAVSLRDQSRLLTRSADHP